jgi:ornithine cyclodeaminase/alanine dehydrogenase-like protein (mu-crystallin family)
MRAILALLVSTCLASAQEGPLFSRHGVGHGAHVCAADKVDEFNTDVIYCVVLPPEG